MVEAICGRLGVVAVPHADLVEAASIRLGNAGVVLGVGDSGSAAVVA